MRLVSVVSLAIVLRSRMFWTPYFQKKLFQHQFRLFSSTTGKTYLMCPLCGECDYWYLSDICLYKKIAYLFDHPGTVFYAVFMSFWGKRKEKALRVHVAGGLVDK